MNKFLIPSALALSLAAAVGVAMTSFATTASAGPVCTTAPRAQWLTETQMRARVAQLGYTNVRVFQVSGAAMRSMPAPPTAIAPRCISTR